MILIKWVKLYMSYWSKCSVYNGNECIMLMNFLNYQKMLISPLQHWSFGFMLFDCINNWGVYDSNSYHILATVVLILL